MQIIHKILNKKNVRLVKWGDPDLPLIICLHGLGGSAFTFYELSQHLKHYQCLSVDLPGHGGSEDLETDYSPEYLMPWLSSLVDSFTNEAFYLLGHSWGATVALHYCAEYPTRVKKVILLDGGYHNSEFRYAYFKDLYDKNALKYKPFLSLDDEITYYKDDFDGFVFDSFEAAVEAEMSQHKGKNAFIRTMIEDLIIKKDDHYIWHANGVTAEKALKFQYHSQDTLNFHKIKSSILLIYCDEPEEYFTYRQMDIGVFKSKCDVKVKLYENTGHMIHYDRPKKLSHDIQVFFCEILKEDMGGLIDDNIQNQ